MEIDTPSDTHSDKKVVPANIEKLYMRSNNPEPAMVAEEGPKLAKAKAPEPTDLVQILAKYGFSGLSKVNDG